FQRIQNVLNAVFKFFIHLILFGFEGLQFFWVQRLFNLFKGYTIFFITKDELPPKCERKQNQENRQKINRCRISGSGSFKKCAGLATTTFFEEKEIHIFNGFVYRSQNHLRQTLIFYII